MHAAIYVIGPDPMERVKRTRLGFDSNPPDWCGIGGRYTGGLIPLPGATGVAYGDTLPQLEAGLLAVMADPRTAAAGPGAQQGPGVDQIARRDLDIDASRSPGYVLDADDRLHGPG